MWGSQFWLQPAFSRPILPEEAAYWRRLLLVLAQEGVAADSQQVQERREA
jgi:hypothetical protein